MRRMLVVLGLVLALGEPAFADDPVAPVEPVAPAAPTDPAGPPAPGSRMRQPEYLQHKPSGFRLPNVTAEGGAYRYKLLAVGAGVLAITTFLTIRYLRRISRDRDRDKDKDQDR